MSSSSATVKPWHAAVEAAHVVVARELNRFHDLLILRGVEPEDLPESLCMLVMQDQAQFDTIMVAPEELVELGLNADNAGKGWICVDAAAFGTLRVRLEVLTFGVEIARKRAILRSFPRPHEGPRVGLVAVELLRRKGDRWFCAG